MGAPAVLQICHLNQLTGVLVARRGSQSVRIAFRRGQVVSATGPDHEGPLVVYDFIGWPHGQFEFDRGALVEGTSDGRPTSTPSSWRAAAASTRDVAAAPSSPSPLTRPSALA